MKRIVSLCLLCLCLQFAYAPICMAAQVYVITPEEMTTLENRFQVVKNNNELLQNKSQQLEQQLKKVNEQLAKLNQLSQTQETQLATLNKSYETSKNAAQKKLTKAKWQRNLWIVLACGFAYCLATK